MIDQTLNHETGPYSPLQASYSSQDGMDELYKYSFSLVRPRQPLRISVAEQVRSLRWRCVIQARDLELLRLLGTIPLLSRDQIWRLYWPGCAVRTVNERLKKLYESYVINCHSPLPVMPQTRVYPGRLYTLDEVGSALLRAEGIPTERAVVRQYPVFDVHQSGRDFVTSLFYLQLRECGVPFIWKGDADSLVYRRHQPEVVAQPQAWLQMGQGQSYYLSVGVTKGWRLPTEYAVAVAEGGWPGQGEGRPFPTVLFLVRDEVVDVARAALRQESGSVRYWLKSWRDMAQADPLTGWEDVTTGAQVSLWLETPSQDGIEEVKQ